MIGLATVISVEDVQSDLYSKVIKQWFRIVVYVQHLNARCLVEAEHFCSIVAVSIPFLLFEILIVEKTRISFYDSFQNSYL